jgi:hypothetical protein
VPAAFADLIITYKDDYQLTPIRALFVKTISYLEREIGWAQLPEIAQLAGLADETVAATILVRMAEEGLLIIEKSTGVIRQNPDVKIEHDRVQKISVRNERISVVGSPPMPALGLTPQQLSRLKAIEIDEALSPAPVFELEAWKEINDQTLEEWRLLLRDASRIQRIELCHKLKPHAYLLEGKFNAEGVFTILDRRSRLKIDLGKKHPLVVRLREVAEGMMSGAGEQLAPFGAWDPEECTLRSRIHEWRGWRRKGGGGLSEVFLGVAGIEVGIAVACLPADEETASAILIDNILARLETHQMPFSERLIAEYAEEERQADAVREFKLPAPILTEIEAAAWDSKRWITAYQIAASGDGL